MESALLFVFEQLYTMFMFRGSWFGYFAKVFLNGIELHRQLSEICHEDNPHEVLHYSLSTSLHEPYSKQTAKQQSCAWGKRTGYICMDTCNHELVSS